MPRTSTLKPIGSAPPSRRAQADLAGRVSALEWPAIHTALDAQGFAVLPGLLDAAECAGIAALYPDGSHFRSHILMARHGFGRGEYKYFQYPLPGIVAELRKALYPELAKAANRWSAMLGVNRTYPPSHAAFLELCHAAGQVRATPLLLQYGAGDYNCLHQDLYGDQVFPIQVVILLSQPDSDFTGGELVLTEQRPRMQSRASVVTLRRGDAAAFAVHHRPMQGTRGVYRVTMRHGVSTVKSGGRHTLGIIFHDAK